MKGINDAIIDRYVFARYVFAQISRRDFNLL